MPPPRPTSAASWPSSACGTGLSWWSRPTRRGSWCRAPERHPSYISRGMAPSQAVSAGAAGRPTTRAPGIPEALSAAKAAAKSPRSRITMALIEFTGLTKRYGSVTAVEDLTFELAPGRVTGFVGANGAGKTTSMRMLLGLTRPTSGSVTIDGRPYAGLAHPLREVGAMVDPDVFHPRRSARNALRVIARSEDLPAQRVDEVLGQVGLAGAARRKVGGFSMGMRQRLALAAALLG